MKAPAIICLLRILPTTVLICLLGCLADPIGLKVKNSLPPDKLSFYSDSFDTFRNDLWDKSAYLYKDSQMANFHLADMIYRNGKLTITTKKDCFSKASLGSRFALQGDFDVQLDCSFNPLRGRQPMNQVLLLLLWDKSTGTVDSFDNVQIAISQTYWHDSAKVFSAARTGGIMPSGNLEDIQGFSGSLRVVRTGRTVTTFYRNNPAYRWRKMAAYLFSTGNLNVGFGLQNFTVHTRRLGKAPSFAAEFFEFKVNAAQGIVEEEI